MLAETRRHHTGGRAKGKPSAGDWKKNSARVVSPAEVFIEAFSAEGLTFCEVGTEAVATNAGGIANTRGATPTLTNKRSLG